MKKKTERQLISDEDNPIIIRVTTFGFPKKRKEPLYNIT